MSTSQGAALILSSRKDKTVFLLLTKPGENCVFQRQRQYQGNEAFGSHYERQAVPCIQQLNGYYTKALERFVGDSCHLFYQPLQEEHWSVCLVSQMKVEILVSSDLP